MRTIYRVEHTDGWGIFRSPQLNRWRATQKLPSMSRRHDYFNTPREDGLICHETDFCAYKSLDKLREMIWHEELQEMVRHGFRVYCLQVSRSKVGRDNVLFKKKYIRVKTDITKQLLKPKE